MIQNKQIRNAEARLSQQARSPSTTSEEAPDYTCQMGPRGAHGGWALCHTPLSRNTNHHLTGCQEQPSLLDLAPRNPTTHKVNVPDLTATLTHLVNMPQTHSCRWVAKCSLRTHCDSGGRHTSQLRLTKECYRPVGVQYHARDNGGGIVSTLRKHTTV